MIKWLVIGVGDITTKRVLPAIMEEERSKLVGIVTRDPAKAEPYDTPGFTDLRTALAKSGADAVYVASPVFMHAPQTMVSLREGRHVLCEKPMAMNYKEARMMVDTAEACGRILGVAYYRRTYPKVHRAMELIQEGVIGQPTLAYASSHGWFTAEDGWRAWLLDPDKAGGGPLYDIASHRIDLLNFMFGQPMRVRAQLSNAVNQTPVEDSATVLIEYQNNVRAIVDVRWHSHVDRDEFRIIGTNGELELTPLNGPRLVSPEGREDLPTHKNIHFPCVENFAEAILDGIPLLSSGRTALWTDWVTEQAVKDDRRSAARI
ncbi:MAG: Gfo/Idh/MocA family oxidoreductase [Acidobacteriota bacterium]